MQQKGGQVKIFAEKDPMEMRMMLQNRLQQVLGLG